MSSIATELDFTEALVEFGQTSNTRLQEDITHPQVPFISSSFSLIANIIMFGGMRAAARTEYSVTHSVSQLTESIPDCTRERNISNFNVLPPKNNQFIELWLIQIQLSN